MQVEIAKSSLVKALQYVIKAIAVNSSMPILQGIKIEVAADGVTFTASHTSMTIQFTLPQDGVCVKVGKAGTLVVPASYFYNMIRKIEHEAVTLEIRERLILIVTSDQLKMRLCGMDAVDFPALDREEEPSLGKLRMDNALFRSTVKQIAVVASTSENRPVLTGVLFECVRNSLNLIATDGVRLASRTLPIENSTSSFSAIIPAKNLYEISRMLGEVDEKTDIEVSHNRMKFTADRLKVETTLIQGAFPSMKSVIPKSYSSEILIDRTSLLTAVECVTIMAGENTIRLAATSDILKLSSRTAEIGDIENEIALLDMSGESFALSLNGRLLVDILRGSNCGRIRIRYVGSDTPLVILPDDPLKSSLYVMSSIRTPV